MKLKHPVFPTSKGRSIVPFYIEYVFVQLQIALFVPCQQWNQWVGISHVSSMMACHTLWIWQMAHTRRILFP